MQLVALELGDSICDALSEQPGFVGMADAVIVLSPIISRHFAP